jgi:hypothetical protein
VRGWLAELPRQLPLLRAELLPEGRPKQGRMGGTGSATAPVPLNLDALNLLAPGWPGPPADPYGDTTGPVPITPLLAGWAGYIAYQYPSVARDRHGTAHASPCAAAYTRRGTDVAAWCHWLTAYLPYAVTLRCIGDMHQQLSDLVRRIRDLTHAAPHRHRKDVPCPKCGAFDLTEVDGQWGINCEACGEHLEPEAYAAHSRALLATYTRPAALEASA